MIRQFFVGSIVVTLVIAGCKPPPPTAGTPSAPAATSPPAAAAPGPRDADATSAAYSAATSTAQSAASAEDLSAVEPDFKMDPADLAKEYKANPQAAGAKYGGKVVLVEGKVMYATSDYVDFGDLSCRFDVPDGNLWKNVAKGSHVTIKGRFLEVPFGVGLSGELRHSVLLAHSESPRLVVTAEQLSAAARESLEEFVRTYEGKDLLMTAEVAAFEPANGPRKDTIVFKTTGAPRVVLNPVRLIPQREAEIARFPVGKTVIVGATFANLPSLDPSVEIVLQLEQVELAAAGTGQAAKP